MHGSAGQTCTAVQKAAFGRAQLEKSWNIPYSYGTEFIGKEIALT